MGTTVRDERLHLRIHSDIKDSIERAARLSGLTVSEFVISTAAQAATRVIGEHQLLRVSDEEYARFVRALEEDAAPSEAALAAARRFNDTTASVESGRWSA